MAEILVKIGRCSTGTAAYQPGDVVVIMPDGHPWGRAELDPATFLILRSDITAQDEAELTAPALNEDDTFLHRRAKRLDLSKLPSNSIAAVSRAMLRAAVVSK